MRKIRIHRTLMPMGKRTILSTHSAIRDDIGDLITRRPLPNSKLNGLDPFLFLNHHGPQTYRPHNQGLPFGPHPHRGFETVTFILSGELAHQDSGGGESIIRAGGVQWMTAGRGLVHSEISPATFLEKGGPLEILQLWVNLPAKLKMTEPRYLGLQADEIPKLSFASGKVEVELVSGKMNEVKGPFHPATGIELSLVRFLPGGSHTFLIPSEETVFFYSVTGNLQVNGQIVQAHQLVEFKADGNEIEVSYVGDPSATSVLLLGHGRPFREPVVPYGPFVMNTTAEIEQAISDYQSGRFEGRVKT